MCRFLIMLGTVLFLSLDSGFPLMTLAATPDSWDSLLAKARAEGSVTVAGPGTVERPAFTDKAIRRSFRYSS